MTDFIADSIEKIFNDEQVKGLFEEMRAVPFGSSAFQSVTFGENQTPERKRRHILLQMHTKLNGLKECQFRRDRLVIDIEELKEQIVSESNPYQKRRFKIDRAEKEYRLKSEEKLIEDTIIELNVFKAELDKTPKITREQFESAEKGYWEHRLLEDASRHVFNSGAIDVGVLKSLYQLGIDMVRDESGKVVALPIQKAEQLLQNQSVSKKK